MFARIMKWLKRPATLINGDHSIDVGRTSPNHFSGGANIERVPQGCCITRSSDSKFINRLAKHKDVS
jgi:hypothetical protein